MLGPREAMPSLVVDGLAKCYGRVRALKGVSFTVDAGEVFGYLGPNGAGKTTTLRILLGLVRPDAGCARLFGKEPADPTSRTDVGYLPGELHLYGGMTGMALIDYFAGFRPHRPPVLRPKLLQAFAVDEATLARRVKFLSHGTKQKIGLLIALQHDPDLILLDEPTSGLDPLMQKAFREVILDCARRGRAVVFSSHALAEVEAVCGRVAILKQGELVAVESMENLRARMIRRLLVRFHGEVPPDLATVPGVARAETAGRETTLWIRGDANSILRRITREDLDHFVFPEPELEDIFLTYYKDSEGEKGRG
jgi:ABC-2 type transport system ATP-binding protein